MTMTENPQIAEMYRTLVQQQLDIYNPAMEALDSESGRVDRRHVVKEANESLEKFQPGENQLGSSDFVDRVANTLGNNFNNDPMLILAVWAQLEKAVNDRFNLDKVVKTRVEQLTAARGNGQATQTLSDEQKTQFREQAIASANMLELYNQMLTQLGLEDLRDELLGELVNDKGKVSKPRESSGPRGPKFMGKFNFIRTDTQAQVADSLGKLAQILGISGGDLKARIAADNGLGEASDDDLRKWFNSPPARFTFHATSDKGETLEYVAVRQAQQAGDGDEGSDDDSDED